MSVRGAALLGVMVMGLVLPAASQAKPGFGEKVDAYCSALGRGTPFADLAGQGFLSECSLCHQFTYPPELPDKGNTFDPPAAEYLAAKSSGDFGWFCPGATNQPPMITPIADRSVNIGEMLVIDVAAIDPDGDPLVLSVANTPAAASFVDHRDGTGTFTWTPGAGDLGSHTLSFLAADDAVPPGQALETVVVTVGSTNRPPVLSAIGNRSTDPGVTLQIPVAASDPDGDALVLTADPLPAGASFSDAGDGTALFSWTPNASQLGNTNLTFAVQDDGVPPAGDSERVTLSVGAINAPPVLAPIGSRNVSAGETLSLALAATDPDGDALQFSAQGLPAAAQLLDAGDGTATLAWQPGAADVGAHPITVTVSDDGVPPEADSEALTLTVSLAAPPSDVRIDAARWSDGRGHGERGGSLRARGSGAAAHEMVGLLDADTGAVLASKRAGRRGQFRFELAPMVPPCAVQVQAGEVRSERFLVGGAPADCGERVQLEVRAAWVCEDGGALRVEGRRAPPGAGVDVLDGASGAVLGTAQAGPGGRFQLEVPLAPAPSAIDVVVSAGEQAWKLEDVRVRVRACDGGDDDDDDDENDDEEEDGAARGRSR